MEYFISGRCARSWNPQITGGEYNEINFTRRPKVTVQILDSEPAFDWDLKAIFSEKDYCSSDIPNQPK